MVSTIRKLSNLAQDINPSTTPADITSQEDFIFVCRGSGMDNESCYSYLKQAGVKRLTRASKRTLTDEDDWEDFVEMYGVEELYPEGEETGQHPRWK